MLEFTLTTAQWIFCSVFAGMCTVLYMVLLFEQEKIEKEMRDDDDLR